MNEGEYIELYTGDKEPEEEIFYGHVDKEVWAESWRRFAGNDWLERCVKEVRHVYARITKKSLSISESKKQGFTKVTVVIWDRGKYEKI